MQKKIAKAFKKRDNDIKEVEEKIVSKKEIELMIKEAVISIREAKLELREHTPRTSRTKVRKKADKLLDKAEIMQEIGSMSEKGLSTTEMFESIVNVRELCKKTCFYKYLKIVSEQISELHER